MLAPCWSRSSTSSPLAVLRQALPAPLPHQQPIVDHQARFKVWRAGRRTGKTRGALYCAIHGHGPNAIRKGLLQGMDVVWIAPDYPQSRVIWAEDIKPRFKGLDGFRLNEQERTVTADGAGTLHIRSAEVIDGVRGIGSRLGGVIIDEAAHLDLEYAIRSVLRPALMDNQGWALFMSTTNAGPDGNHEKRLPSYFNLICEQIRSGERNEDWVEFTGTAYDNSRLPVSEVDDLVAEYPPDSPALKQEVFAELLRAGIGLALPGISEQSHIVPRFTVPAHWTQFGAFDWGFNHPWVFGWYAADEDGNVVKVETQWGREDLPDEIARKIIATGAPVHHSRYIVHAGHDIFTKKGKAVGFTGPTVAESLQAAGIKVIPADTGRVLGLDNLRAYIYWEPPSERHPSGRAPRFTLMDTPGNRRCLAQLQGMQVDPDNLEDALKVDADAAGKGGDDSYDETRYGLMSRPLRAKPVNVASIPQDRSLGYDWKKGRPAERQSAEQLMAQIITRAQPQPGVNRYRAPRRG